MDNYSLLLTNVLAFQMQAKQYDKLYATLIADRDTIAPLVNTGATQEELIDFLTVFGPQEENEVLDADFQALCQDILPLAFAKGHYTLCGAIYGFGFCGSDPLCKYRHPLVFAAMENCPAFAAAYIAGQARFDYLSFDEHEYQDGAYRSLLERLVLIDQCAVVEMCLKAGASPNAFGCSGGRLLDVARSQEMKDLLLAHGAKPATEQEKHLVRTVFELRYDCLTRQTVDLLLAQKTPLMYLEWMNGFTASSSLETADLYLEVARACNYELLEALYPYVEKSLDDAQWKKLLLEILGSNIFGFNIVGEERPIDIPRSLETLLGLGVRYPAQDVHTADHPILDLMEAACWCIDLGHIYSFGIQRRIFEALWELGGRPLDQAVLDNMEKIALDLKNHQLNMFVRHLKMNYWEEIE